MRMTRYNCCSLFFFFSSRRRHTRCSRDWSSDVCSSDLLLAASIFLGIALCVTGSIALPLGMLCGLIIFPLLKYTILVVSWCASIPYAFSPVGNLDMILAWCYYVLLIFIVSFALRRWPQ